MPGEDEGKAAKDYQVKVPFAGSGLFHVKGMNNVDWGMKDRLSRVFRRETGKTIMLAFDHGYIMGSTAGLREAGFSNSPAHRPRRRAHGNQGGNQGGGTAELRQADCVEVFGRLHCTGRGHELGVCRGRRRRRNTHERVSDGDPGVYRFRARCAECKEPRRNHRCGQPIRDPVLGVCAVGKQMERNERYFLLATRVIAELGAQVIKTYYCEPGFDRIVAACPVPIVIAGGKKMPEKEALELAWKAIDCGAAGVDMGRNIFQADSPVAMLKAIGAIVHGGESVKNAWQLYEDARASQPR